MKRTNRLLMLAFVCVTAAILTHSDGLNQPGEADAADSDRFPRLIRFEPTGKDPFVLNEAAFEKNLSFEEEMARERFSTVMSELGKLASEYPNTATAKEAAELLDKANLIVASDGKVYPKNTIFMSGIPFTR